MKTTITFELETNIREQLAAICSRYNLSLEEAFTSFAEVVVQAGRLPYDMEVPNAVTQAAMAAAEKGEGLSGAFDSAPELMAALGYTQGNSRLWGDRIFEKCGIGRDERGDGGKTLEIRGKRRLSARDRGANYQQS